MPVVVTIRKAGPIEEPIRRAAEAMEPVIREAFLAAVERLRAAVSVDKLLTYLARGDVNGALAYLAVDRRFAAILQGAGEAGLGAFRAALQRSFGAGALAAASEMPRAATVRAAFDLANPKAVSFLQRYAFDLIKQVSQETRDAIKQTVLRAFREGGHPYQQARTIQRNLGLTTTQEQAVANYRVALENGQYREALQRALRDGRYDASLLRAQRDGTRLAQARIDKMVERYRQRFIQYRARNIARTECLTGETLVSGAVVRAIRRRWYVGPVFDITTSEGRKFTTTPNHPMLTRRGWIFSRNLTELDYLVCGAMRQQSSSARYVDMDCPPSTLIEIFDSLRYSGNAVRERSSHLDFHGDGMDGDVDTLYASRTLRVGVFSPLYKATIQNTFSPPDLGATSFCCFCQRLLNVNEQPCFCVGAQTASLIAEDSLYGVPIYAKDLREMYEGLTRSVSSGDLSVGQVITSCGDGAPTFEKIGARANERSCGTSLLDYVPDPACVGVHSDSDLIDAQAAAVETDRVLSISVRAFCGHVFSLETPYGYFTVNGAFTGNSLRASNAGQLELWRQSRENGLIPADAEKEWIVSGDERTCPECMALDGTAVPLDEEFAPGVMAPPDPHPQCLPGGSIVLAQDVQAAVKRIYDGVLIVLETAAGCCLACTPNHPVLTPRGWVPAHLLQVGSDVVSDSRHVGGGTASVPYVGRHMHNQNMPSRIEDIANTFSNAVHVYGKPVPTAAPDFHGDGVNGNVAVVWTDGLLRGCNEPALREPIRQLDFSLAAIGQVSFDSRRQLYARCRQGRRAFDSGVCGFGKCEPSFTSYLLHAEKHGITAGTRSFTALAESSADDTPADLEMDGNLFYRPSGFELADYVVSRYALNFSGHVFNLQTASGSYTAEGIITHNCRCSMKLSKKTVMGFDPADWEAA